MARYVPSTSAERPGRAQARPGRSTSRRVGRGSSRDCRAARSTRRRAGARSMSASPSPNASTTTASSSRRCAPHDEHVCASSSTSVARVRRDRGDARAGALAASREQRAMPAQAGTAFGSFAPRRRSSTAARERRFSTAGRARRCARDRAPNSALGARRADRLDQLGVGVADEVGERRSSRRTPRP